MIELKEKCDYQKTCKGGDILSPIRPYEVLEMCDKWNTDGCPKKVIKCDACGWEGTEEEKLAVNNAPPVCPGCGKDNEFTEEGE